MQKKQQQILQDIQQNLQDNRIFKAKKKAGRLATMIVDLFDFTVILASLLCSLGQCNLNDTIMCI